MLLKLQIDFKCREKFFAYLRYENFKEKEVNKIFVLKMKTNEVPKMSNLLFDEKCHRYLRQQIVREI